MIEEFDWEKRDGLKEGVEERLECWEDCYCKSRGVNTHTHTLVLGR